MDSHQPKIVVVDDDIFDREQLTRSLQETGLTNPVCIACDGVEAMSILRGTEELEPLRPPYIILLDWNMPRMNGLEFLIELRNDPDLNRAVVFVLTTSDEDSDRLAAYDHQVAGYIVKGDGSRDFSDIAHLLGGFCQTVSLPDR